MCGQIAVIVLTGACSSTAPGPGGTTVAGKPSTELLRLSDAAEAQERRILELEARIALLEQEARSAQRPTTKPTETVRIGTSARNIEDSPSLPARESVAVVRLHEEPAPRQLARPVAGQAQQDWTLPVAPRGVPTSLEVVPLPEDRAKLELQGAAVDPRARYRDALALLQARRFDDALAQLAALSREVPADHPLAAQATYWKGEAHYAARRYRDALVAFEALIARFPSSTKVPDALLKAGLCNKRLGQDALAQRYFEQVRKEHPTSDAAQSAPREGSS